MKVEPNVFEAWEHKFTYGIGRCVGHGWAISVKQASQAKRLYEEAMAKGFHVQARCCQECATSLMHL